MYSYFSYYKDLLSAETKENKYMYLISADKWGMLINFLPEIGTRKDIVATYHLVRFVF